MNGYDFSFDRMTGENREFTCVVYTNLWPRSRDVFKPNVIMSERKYLMDYK